MKEKQPYSVITVEHLNFFYGKHQALYDISLDIPAREVTAFIGPSRAGKSTLLRCFNRMNDIIPGSRVEGTLLIEDDDIYQEGYPLEPLRTKVGMVSQGTNPFPMSIYQNVAFGPRMAGIRAREKLEESVEFALKQVNLWEAVKDKLHHSAFKLSEGEQQRLCIARTLANAPHILLIDDPTASLDPISTERIEATIRELQSHYTIVVGTRKRRQAARISDRIAFFWDGKLVEYGTTEQIFTNPKEKLTDDYITGRSG